MQVMTMSKSILQNYEIEKECFECRSTKNLQEHHVFGGPNRNLSEKYGFKVLLCIKHHTDNKHGVHGENKNLRVVLKQIAQREFEKNHSREDFINIFGKSYL